MYAIRSYYAKEMGVKVVISTDAHSPRALANMRYGVDQARRGWLTREDVLNTRSLGVITSYSIHYTKLYEMNAIHL